MSTLLVDIGNTRVKWARLVRGRVGRQHAAAHEGWSGEHIARHIIRNSGRTASMRVDRIVVVSVAGAKIDRGFAAAARKAVSDRMRKYWAERRKSKGAK